MSTHTTTMKIAQMSSVIGASCGVCNQHLRCFDEQNKSTRFSSQSPKNTSINTPNPRTHLSHHPHPRSPPQTYSPSPPPPSQITSSPSKTERQTTTRMLQSIKNSARCTWRRRKETKNSRTQKEKTSCRPVTTSPVPASFTSSAIAVGGSGGCRWLPPAVTTPTLVSTTTADIATYGRRHQGSISPLAGSGGGEGAAAFTGGSHSFLSRRCRLHRRPPRPPISPPSSRHYTPLLPSGHHRVTPGGKEEVERNEEEEKERRREKNQESLRGRHKNT